MDAVRLAVDHGFPVAVRATGHGPIPGVDRGLLVDTRAMSTVTVDPGRRTATVGAGTTWTSVLAACAPYGLAPLCGSAPDVGAVSYVLGGGLGVLGRRYGYAADRVRRIRLVTATGEPREVTPDSDPELFWAVRGGGGNFGVATELEIDLVPVAALYGGGLFFPGEAAADLLAAFGRCTADAPDELSLSIAFITFPDLDAVPPPLRGRFVGHLRVAHLGAPAEAEALIAPLRAVATPFVDTVRTLPVAEIGTIHADPVRPQPVSCGGAVLPRWDDAAIDVLLSGIGATRPHMLEVRHLGGALARPADVPNAVGHRDALFNVFTSAYPGPSFDDATTVQTDLYRRLRPWTGGRRCTTSRADRTVGPPMRERPSTRPASPGSRPSRRRGTRRTCSGSTSTSRLPSDLHKRGLKSDWRGIEEPRATVRSPARRTRNRNPEPGPAERTAPCRPPRSSSCSP